MSADHCECPLLSALAAGKQANWPAHRWSAVRRRTTRTADVTQISTKRRSLTAALSPKVTYWSLRQDSLQWRRLAMQFGHAQSALGGGGAAAAAAVAAGRWGGAGNGGARGGQDGAGRRGQREQRQQVRTVRDAGGDSDTGQLAQQLKDHFGDGFGAGDACGGVAVIDFMLLDIQVRNQLPVRCQCECAQLQCQAESPQAAAYRDPFGFLTGPVACICSPPSALRIYTETDRDWLVRQGTHPQHSACTTGLEPHCLPGGWAV